MAVGLPSRLWAAGLGVPVPQSPCSENIYHVGVHSVPSLVRQGSQTELLQAVAAAVAGI